MIGGPDRDRIDDLLERGDSLFWIANLGVRPEAVNRIFTPPGATQCPDSHLRPSEVYSLTQADFKVLILG